MTESRASTTPPVAGRVRFLGLAMAFAVALFAIVALVFAGTVETELPGGAAWAIAAAGLLLLAAGQALDGPDPGRKIVSLAAREATGLLGAVLTFLTGSWVFATALGGLALVAIVAALPAADETSPR